MIVVSSSSAASSLGFSALASGALGFGALGLARDTTATGSFAGGIPMSARISFPVSVSFSINALAMVCKSLRLDFNSFCTRVCESFKSLMTSPSTADSVDPEAPRPAFPPRMLERCTGPKLVFMPTSLIM